MEWVTISSAWGIGSGVIVALLGLVVLVAAGVRPRGSFAFGAFAMAWGAQIALYNAAFISPSLLLSERLYLYGMALLTVAPFLLSAFVFQQPLWSTRRAVCYAVLALTGSIGFAAVTALALRPELLFIETRALPTGQHLPIWGPLMPPLIVAPLFGALGFAFHTALTGLRSSPTERIAKASEHFAVGLGVILAFTSGWYIVYHGMKLALPLDPENTLFFALFLALVATVIFNAVKAFLRAQEGTRGSDSRRHRKMFWLLVLPLAWGATESWLSLEVLPGLQTLGAWRIVGVGFIVLGLQQWRMVTISARTRKIMGRASGTVAAAAGGIIVTTAAAASTTQLPIVIASGLTVAALSWSPLSRLASKALPHSFADTSRPNPTGVDEGYEGRIEAYRAAIESSVAAQRLEDDRRFLSSLRERLGITTEEHRLILHMARQSVVAQRNGDGEFYAKLRLLGEGGMGRTWLVRDRREDRLAVIKEPLPHWQAEPSVRRAIEKEAKLAASVRHPNVLRTEALLEAGTPVILMEYAEGGTLTDLLRSRGTLPWAESRSLTLDVLAGLQAIHSRGIVHRDLKPSNIFLDREGRAMIGDFGVARDVLHDKTQIMTQVGLAAQGAVGTPAFMAPEVKSGGKADEAADLYAAAAVLYTCLVGLPPGLARQIPNGAPAEAVRIIERGLAEDPGERFTSAKQFAHRLQAV